MKDEKLTRWESAKPMLIRFGSAAAPTIFPTLFPIGIILWAQVNGWLPFPLWPAPVTGGLLGAIVALLLLEEIGVYFLAQKRNASYLTFPGAAFILAQQVIVEGADPWPWGMLPSLIFIGTKVILGAVGKAQTGKFGGANRALPYSLDMEIALFVCLYGFRLIQLF